MRLRGAISRLGGRRGSVLMARLFRIAVRFVRPYYFRWLLWHQKG